MEVSLPQRIKFWLTEAQHDCFFVVGPEDGPTERIGATKILLMGDSKPFRAMLQESDLAEKGDIHITDIEPATFHNYLKCAYGGSDILIPKLTFEELVKLLYVTDKYLAYEITNQIISQMRGLLSSSSTNMFLVLPHSVCYQNWYLKNEILKILTLELKKMTMDNRFLELPETSIAWLLQQECFVVKEVDIWNATLQWVKHKTGSTDGQVLRSSIFHLLEYFRFLSMDFTEFWENVVTSEILLEEEVLDICKAFGTGKLCSISYLSNDKRSRYNIGNVSDIIVSSFLENPINAFISCSVSKISSLGTSHENSKTYWWAGHVWMVLLHKTKTNNAKKSCQKKYALSVYVECRGQGSSWSCPVSVDLSLMNQKGKPNLSSSFNHSFSVAQSSRGFATFQEWNSLIDSENGFVKDDTIVLVAKIQLRH